MPLRFALVFYFQKFSEDRGVENKDKHRRTLQQFPSQSEVNQKLSRRINKLKETFSGTSFLTQDLFISLDTFVFMFGGFPILHPP